MGDVYYHPESYGLEVIGEISWSDESYQFDYTVLWRDTATGDLYYASDSGCSCPSPFEDIESVDQLTKADTWSQVDTALREILAEQYWANSDNEWGYGPGRRSKVEGDIGELVLKARAAMLGWSPR